jgi:hypothetical protein
VTAPIFSSLAFGEPERLVGTFESRFAVNTSLHLGRNFDFRLRV